MSGIEFPLPRTRPLTNGEQRLLQSAESAESAETHTYRANRAYGAPERWQPPSLEPAAMHGLAGLWVEATQPFTEAAPVGVLVSTLIGFGSAVGASPFVQVGATRHHANDFAVVVGPTATGRKGDAMNMGLRPIRLADPEWAIRVVRGFGSGEAVVAEVADPEGEDEVPADKRLLVHEDELAHPLAVAAREGSTLSPLMRSAWDGTRLENRTRQRKLVATDAHVAVLAGITPSELARCVSATEIGNGLANRFVFVAVLRSKHLPNPPRLTGDVEDSYVGAFRDALEHGRQVDEMRRDNDAADLWAELYRSELSVEREGLAGAACSRAEAHALRLSMLFALLDCSRVIKRPHVEAAVALWRYSEQSALLVFGSRLGDPDADTILEALDAAGTGGLARDEVRDLFSRHRTRAQLDLTLARLEQLCRVRSWKESTGGRPVTRYAAAAAEGEAR